MNHNRVRIKACPNCFKLPEYKAEGAAAADCYAAIPRTITVNPGKTAIVPLGFMVEIPEEFFMAVLSRSGLATKGIQIGNCPGVVDSDYRGEVCAMVYNGRSDYSRDHQDMTFTIDPGDRICQVALLPAYRMDFEVVGTLSDTRRGTWGMGSTGIASKADTDSTAAHLLLDTALEDSRRSPEIAYDPDADHGDTLTAALPEN